MLVIAWCECNNGSEKGKYWKKKAASKSVDLLRRIYYNPPEKIKGFQEYYRVSESRVRDSGS